MKDRNDPFRMFLEQKKAQRLVAMSGDPDSKQISRQSTNNFLEGGCKGSIDEDN